MRTVPTRWLVAGTYLLGALALVPSALGEPIKPTDVADDTVVSFNADVLPVLKKNCVACHNATKTEAEINVESYEAIFHSEYGELVSAGEPDESRLYVLAAHGDEPVMPPDVNNVAAKKLTSLELGLLRAWIQRGAKPDPKPSHSESIAWKSLPASAAPTFATSLTGDARLTAASFGNRVRMFGKQSPRPIAELRLQEGDAPAHRDFVQDLHVSDDGLRVVSAGYRNVKIWELSPAVSEGIPTVLVSDRLAVSPSGTHIASLSADGVVNVAPLGQSKWEWSKPSGVTGKPLEQVSEIAVSNDGATVAVLSGVDVHLIPRDGDLSEPVKLAAIGTSVGAAASDRVLVGDQAGVLTTLVRTGAKWEATAEDVFENTVEFLALSADGESAAMADAVGNFAWRPRGADSFTVRMKLPTGAANAAIAHDDSVVWVGLTNGGLGRVDSTSKNFEDIATNDPVLDDRWQRAKWDAAVGERLVAADEADLKRTETNHQGEETNQEKLTADIDKRNKDLTAATKALEDSKAVAAASQVKLVEATTAFNTAKEEREKVEASIKSTSDELARLQAANESPEAVAALTKKKSEQEAALKALPVLKPLEGAETAAKTEADKAAEELKAKTAAREDAEAAVKLANESKGRSDQQLAKLATEIESWKSTVEKAKSEQESRKKRQADRQAELGKSRPFNGGVVALGEGGFATRGTSGEWSLWSTAGDWICTIDGAPSGDEAVVAASGVVLQNVAEQGVVATRVLSPAWRLKRSIGESLSESPFTDRVLCLDVSSSGNVLATGGGDPSRRGEVHLWNLDDGSIVHSIEKAHSDTVLALKFSPDGKQLATSSADRLIKIWDVTTGDMVGVLEGHTHHVTTVDWNVSQRQLTSASADFDVRAWDLHTMKTSRKISLFQSEVTDVVYAGQYNRVGVVGGDQTFRMVSTDNGRQESTAGLANGYGYSISASRDGELFVVGGADGKPRMVDKKGKTVQQFTAE